MGKILNPEGISHPCVCVCPEKPPYMAACFSGCVYRCGPKYDISSVKSRVKMKYSVLQPLKMLAGTLLDGLGLQSVYLFVNVNSENACRKKMYHDHFYHNNLNVII